MTTPTAAKPLWRLLALTSVFCGVAGGVSLKLAGDMPSAQAVIMRTATAFAVVMAISMVGTGRLRISFGRTTLIRALLDGAAGFGFALAIFELPISLLTAFLAALPAFSTLFAALFLGEKPRALVWVGIAGAFAGCLIILRPALEFSTYGVALALCGNIGFAARDVYTRKIGRGLDVHSSVLLSYCFVIGCSLVLSPAQGWAVPTLRDGGFAILAGLFGAGAGLLIALAHQNELVSRIAPLRFTSLLWALLLDYMIWSFVPDRTAWIGILVTSLSVLLVLHQSRTPAHKRRG
ncbi:DMT family transporter [Cognatishimia sp. SS12]|uniref:DMT family transporter n=1 Tax=Cognatishimia sp. SS12 TaxID=2979465 RepID=UPI00232E77A8|nr:DMT family transporter [Cognatishimia sp. SS12]MDC0738317.1 DMT family transporter [Cognatishimia sp. SS12]